MKIASKPRKLKTKGVIPPRVPSAKEKTAVFTVSAKSSLDKSLLENKGKS